jgi:F0F1-type ATP synthase membrane subunit b/b'
MTEILLTAPTVRQAGLVDLDATWFIQIGLFLLLYALLTLLFFKPYVAFLRRRDERTRGLRERAQDLVLRATELEGSLQALLAEARTRGVADRRALVEEGARLRDSVVAKERQRVQFEIERELSELDRQKQAFVSRLDALAGELAGMIESRMRVEGK